MMQNGVPMNGTVRDRGGAFDRAVDILETLADGRARSLTELGRELGLPKSTVHRLLASLEARALVERRPDGIALGPFARRLGRAALGRDPLLAAARGPVAELARELGETVFLVVERGGSLRVAHAELGTGLVRAAPEVGAEVPVHATGAGRLYLAFGAGRVSFPSVLEAYTGATPSSRDALQSRVERARTRGFDENVDEWIEGLSVLSVPIAGEQGLTGVLSVACESRRFRALGGRALAPRLFRTATTIRKQLGDETP